jgi:hypothetical protein
MPKKANVPEGDPVAAQLSEEIRLFGKNLAGQSPAGKRSEQWERSRKGSKVESGNS